MNKDLCGDKLLSGGKMKKTKVAFVCVHNSCRDQIAEAFVEILGDSIEV